MIEIYIYTYIYIYIGPYRTCVCVCVCMRVHARVLNKKTNHSRTIIIHAFNQALSYVFGYYSILKKNPIGKSTCYLL